MIEVSGQVASDQHTSVDHTVDVLSELAVAVVSVTVVSITVVSVTAVSVAVVSGVVMVTVTARVCVASRSN